MSQSVTVSMLITGHFPEQIFTDWIAHRAGLLDLAGWVKTTAPDKIELQVTGHKVMVEALETACCLGPMDVDIESVESQVSASQTRHASSSCAQFVILN
ncbi:MAG: acylphosphatase [Granulosicoccus sp.]|nr:acylphosphatase [Granulosicoccus sp.]